MTPDPFSLAGRNALVIGGTSGIGKAIAAGFAKAGAQSNRSTLTNSYGDDSSLRSIVSPVLSTRTTSLE